jgi:hypothetical protein
MKAALKILFALALIGMASAPRLWGAPPMNGPAVQVLACNVSSDPSPADFSVPAGAIPLGLAMADFTGDTHPDLATLELDRLDSSHAYYVIEIHLTEGGRQSLRLTAPARSLVLTPMDVRGDGILDLVVHSDQEFQSLFSSTMAAATFLPTSLVATRPRFMKFPVEDLISLQVVCVLNLPP